MNFEQLKNDCSKLFKELDSYETELNAIFNPPKEAFIDLLKLPEIISHQYSLYLNRKGKKSIPKPQLPLFQETLTTYNYHLYEKTLIKTHSAKEFRGHVLYSAEEVLNQFKALLEEVENNISCLLLEKKAYEVVDEAHIEQVTFSITKSKEMLSNIRGFIDQCSSAYNIQTTVSDGVNKDYTHQIDKALKDTNLVDFFKGALHLFQAGQQECFDLSVRNAYFTSAQNILASIPNEERGTIHQQLNQQMKNAKKQTMQALKVLQSIDGQATLLDPELLEKAWKKEKSSLVLNAMAYLQDFAFQAGQIEVSQTINTLFLDFFEEPMNLAKIQQLNDAQNLINNIGQGPLKTFLEEESGGSLSSLSNFLYFSNVVAEGYWDTLLYQGSAVKNYGLKGSSYRMVQKHEFQIGQESRTPTDHREIGRTSDMRKMKRFVRFDPKTTPMRLMAGQQPYKKYYSPPRKKSPDQVIVKREIKYYLLDASPSMKFSRGLRARFRDALLIGQLNQSSVEAKKSGVQDTFFVQTFDMRPHELFKVSNEEEAKKMISKVFEGLKFGKGTNITRALIEAFETIAEAQENDPDLYKASVVLVTDGEDEVDKEAIEKVRKNIRDDLDIVFHFISIVIGNEDLKSIVESQTSQGVKAQFIHVNINDIEALNLPQKTDKPVYFEIEHEKTLDPKILKSFNSLKTTHNIARKTIEGSNSQKLKELFPSIKKAKVEKVIAPFETISTVENVLSIIDEMKLLYISTQEKESIVLTIFEYLMAQHELSQKIYLQVIHNDASPIILDKLKRIRWGLGLEKQINKEE